jgi:hypothetical protein
VIRVTSVCLLAIAAFAVPAFGQVPSKGSEFFRFALAKKGFKPINEHEWVQEFQRHEDLLIVILGDTSNIAAEFRGGLRDYVDRGGALLIATSKPHDPRLGNPPEDWRASFGITIAGSTLRAAAPEFGYEGKVERPFVKPRQPVNPRSPSPFDLFNGVEVGGKKGVATAQPSELQVQGVRGLLTKELAGYAEGTRSQNGQPLARDGIFAVSLEPVNGSGGRAIVLADGRVFSNDMMGFKPKQDDSGDYETDNGNWEFANRTIDWLQGGRPDHPKKRFQCLFIENGQIVDKFANEVQTPPKPPIPDIPPDVLANILLNHANGMIREAEEQNFFNRVLESWFGFPRLVRMFLIVVTIVFILFALRWLRRGFRKAEPGATLTKNVQAGLLPRGGVLKQRTAAQFEVGNLYEAARRRVRSRFDVLGARPGSDGKMPPVLTANDLPDGPMIYQTVRWLWGIGYAETPVTVAPTEWDRVNALLERVTARAARGDWSFGQDVYVK